MNDQRRDQGGLIVLGCLLVGLLSVCLLGGSALFWVRMVQMQQATRAQEEAREAQAAARSAEEKAASPQDAAQPETAKSTNN